MRFLTLSNLFNNVLSTLLFEIKDCQTKKEMPLTVNFNTHLMRKSAK